MADIVHGRDDLTKSQSPSKTTKPIQRQPHGLISRRAPMSVP